MLLRPTAWVPSVEVEVISLLNTKQVVERHRLRFVRHDLVTPCCRARSYLRGGLSECVFCGAGYALGELERKEANA